jgi:hypothetical protein
MLFHPRSDGWIPLDSAIESQQFRSHRRSTFCSRDLWLRRRLRKTHDSYQGMPSGIPQAPCCQPRLQALLR